MPNRRSFLKLTGAVGGTALAGGTAAAQSTEEFLADVELPAEDEKPLVRLVSTGGTIASTEAASEGAGYSLSEEAEAIVDAVPLLDYFVDIEIDRVAQKGSSSLLVEDYVGVAKAAKRAEADGADGVIVTHGTDAIEEDAYFNDLVLDLDIPVAFVGAMRAADAVSADGPSNLLTAVRMITRNEFHLSEEPSGVYVVLNETVHAARDVTKTNTTKVETFDSGPAGPIAVFTDDELLLYREPGSYSSDLSGCDLDTAAGMVVPIVTTGAGADAYPIEQAISGAYDVDGITVQSTGRGGSAPEISEASQAAVDAGIPVVRASRVHYGPLGPSDEAGSVVITEDLPAWKARLHLIVALTVTTDLEGIRETVEEGKYGTPVVAPSTLH
ncbi:Asparaginase/glutaminase [Halalkalicoccus jeotgali B3]|uniref:Asparaginase/glutaminase n=2 Tax=Halalkalicoccus jeotgali TaxID=413810 RepID=D8J7V3_HALJB|nr:asparaginase [Halalkalicoccus jeotgali]ADJ16123.1 Asparaginase/glutaminase [Halalkalicoccus jeotgali B3]